MYVGATPTTGDFKILDSITTSSATTFNLRQGGVAVYPQSANHCLVVLNGVLQTAGSSFNIVNDTIVFASSLSSSDVINQILVLGNVNDIGVPSSDTVDESKLKVSNSPTNGYMLTAQSAAAGGLTWAAQPSGFDVSSITGATALAEEPSSTDELVISDGGTLKRLDFAHIYNTPSFHAHASGNQTISDNTLTKVQFPSEDYDTSSTFDHSTNHRFTPGIAGKYFLYYQFKIETGANNNNFDFIEGHIYKNGSTIAKINNDFRDDNLGRHHTITTGLVVESDADDYFEVFGLGNIQVGTPVFAGGSHETFFGGYRLVGA